MGESAAAKRAKVSAASGAPPAIAMHTLLGIPELRPEWPAMPDEFLIMTGAAPTPYEYIPTSCAQYYSPSLGVSP